MACPGRRRVLVWVAVVLMSVVVRAGGGGTPTEEDVHAQVLWVLGLMSRHILDIVVDWAPVDWANGAQVDVRLPEKRNFDLPGWVRGARG